MMPVAPVDRLVSMLRQRLQERDRLAAGRRPSAAARGGAVGPIDAARALAAIEDVDDRQLRRALIQGLLTDHFGSAAVNEAGFQQMVDRVVDAVQADESGRALLGRLSNEIRAQAR